MQVAWRSGLGYTLDETLVFFVLFPIVSLLGIDISVKSTMIPYEMAGKFSLPPFTANKYEKYILSF